MKQLRRQTGVAEELNCGCASMKETLVLSFIRIVWDHVGLSRFQPNCRHMQLVSELEWPGRAGKEGERE